MISFTDFGIDRAERLRGAPREICRAGSEARHPNSRQGGLNIGSQRFAAAIAGRAARARLTTTSRADRTPKIPSPASEPPVAPTVQFALVSPAQKWTATAHSARHRPAPAQARRRPPRAGTGGADGGGSAVRTGPCSVPRGPEPAPARRARPPRTTPASAGGRDPARRRSRARPRRPAG